MSGNLYKLEVRPRIPERIVRLRELASNLYYSWSSNSRSLFVYLDRQLWEECGHSPSLFLRRVSQPRLEQAVTDRTFMENYHRALADFDTYLSETEVSIRQNGFTAGEDIVAYFSFEYGFHESVPLYSGGLGILAADHCKAAADLGVPLVAVGLLYRQGYFTQTIDARGSQEAHYHDTDFSMLPISLVKKRQQELHITVELPDRAIALRVWEAKAGHVRLYLLDSDLPENSDADRTITHQLYGGDANTRILQEITLGIGGARALQALGLEPIVWHINEGHAAFQIVERCRVLTQQGLDFNAALELVAAGTVFTTHTPVPAGHDIFASELVSYYFTTLVGELGVSIDEFLSLGSSPGGGGGFNMTALALRGSRFHNGVSQIHGRVASEMEGYIWPEVPHTENPIDYVTNGVHVSTFLATEWQSLFDRELGHEWRNKLLDDTYWQRIAEIADYNYWSVRQTLKAELFKDVRQRTITQHQRNGCSDWEITRLTCKLSPANTDTMVLGFARRFATYKRAALLLNDPDRLARLLNDPDKPVILIFAGKAHPSDFPGQKLISIIYEYSRRPEFEGKLILLEDYNLSLGRTLVKGVDVWLNTPEYPLEASGTSGQKAAINGVVNVSVLDGWWAEGYNGENGWAIVPHAHHHEHTERDKQEARVLFDILEKDVIPLFYRRNGHGYSEGWVKKSKASMLSVMPHFNAQRMVTDYVNKLYLKAKAQKRLLEADEAKVARQLARWKTLVTENWAKVSVRRIDVPLEDIEAGDRLPILVGVKLGELNAKHVVVECLIGKINTQGEFTVQQRIQLEPKSYGEAGETLFRLELAPALSGLQYYKLRVYPHHPMLSQVQETGLMIWL